MNKPISQEQLTRIKGKYQVKYGETMDDWSAIMMNEIEEGFTNAFVHLKDSKEQIETASKLIKGELKTIRFKDAKEAFRFGLGISIPISIVLIVISFLISWFVNQTQNYEEQRHFLENFGNATLYQELIQKGKVIEINGFKFLVLKPTKNDAKIGKEYFFRRKESDILIPLTAK